MDVRDRFDALARERGPGLLRVAYQLTHDRVEAEDVVQSALARVYASIARHDRWPDEPAAYLRRAVVNEFLRASDRRRIAIVRELEDADDPATSNVPAAFEDRDAVWTALGRLPARQRTALVLRYYEDLDDVTIADVLRCRRATVRSLVARGLRALDVNRFATALDALPVTTSVGNCTPAIDETAATADPAVRPGVQLLGRAEHERAGISVLHATHRQRIVAGNISG